MTRPCVPHKTKLVFVNESEMLASCQHYPEDSHWGSGAESGMMPLNNTISTSTDY